MQDRGKIKGLKSMFSFIFEDNYKWNSPASQKSKDLNKVSLLLQDHGQLSLSLLEIKKEKERRVRDRA